MRVILIAVYLKIKSTVTEPRHKNKILIKILKIKKVGLKVLSNDTGGGV